MAKLKLNFQTILFGVFGLFAVIAIIVFATTGGQSGAGGSAGTVTVWGTLPEEIVTPQIALYVSRFGDAVTIEYREFEEETFDESLLQALAAGQGPDLFFLSQDKILEHEDKVLVIPYENFPERTFNSQFIDEAQLFLTPSGVVAFPLLIDPMVMYYNRDILSSSFLVQPPEYWDDFLTFVPTVASQTESGEIIQSAVALGTFDNVNHAKDIFALLMLQLQNPIIARDADGEYVSTLRARSNNVSAADSTLRFLTSFSDPVKDSYSWNTSLADAKEAFLAGELAVYFGYASELQELRRRNPNLNFDVTLMPQIRNTQGAQLQMTHGKMYGLAISRISDNIGGAFNVANAFSSPDFVQFLSNNTILPPIRREVLAQRPNDPFFSLFYDAAIISRSWLDPDPEETDGIFRDLIRNHASGALNPFDNINQADAAIKELLP